MNIKIKIIKIACITDKGRRLMVTPSMYIKLLIVTSIEAKGLIE